MAGGDMGAPQAMIGALLKLGLQLMSNRRTVICATFMLVAAADSAFGQGYGGPSMLSRAGNSPGRRGRAPMDFVVYGAVRGTYETGLTAVRVDDQGNISSNAAFGTQVEGGAYGARSWQKTSVGLDYRGDYRQTTNRRFSNYNGTNQALSLDVQHQFNRRLVFAFRESGGTTNRAFGGFAAPAVSDVNNLNLANTEVFDTRTYFSTTSGTLLFQRSARMSLVSGGDAFFVRRPDRRLVGVNGNRAIGGLNYRLSRRVTAGGIYTYMQFRYPRVVGGADMHGMSLSLGRVFTPNLSGSISGGAFRLTTFGDELIQLSPEVAAILGRSTGVAAFRRTGWIPQASASLRYLLERSSVYATISSGVSPGNGVYQTSRSTLAGAGYTYTGIRRLSVGVSANHARLSSRSVTTSGGLRQSNAGVGVTYRLRHMLSVSSQIDWRNFSSPGISGRSGFAAMVGLSVSPTRVPLSIW